MFTFTATKYDKIYVNVKNEIKKCLGFKTYDNKLYLILPNSKYYILTYIQSVEDDYAIYYDTVTKTD